MADNTGFLIQPQKELTAKTTDFTTLSDFPSVGEPFVFYKALDTGLVYRFISGSYDETDSAVDINNKLCEDSGLPQAKKPNPTDSDTYRVLNTTACPVDPGNEVELTLGGSYNDLESRFEFTATLSAVLTEDLQVTFKYVFLEYGLVNLGLTQIISISAGDLNGGNQQPYTTSNTITDVSPEIISVEPNPNGTKTVTY